MSDAVMSSQQSEINRLNSELAKVRAEAAKYRKERSEARKSVEELTEKYTKLEADHTKLKTDASAAPSETQKALDKALGEIREGKHRKAFDKAAKAAGVDEGRLDDFRALSGYQAEGDAIDDGAITAKVTEALAARPYFGKVAGADNAGEGQPAKPSQTPVQGAGPGANRGSSDTSGAGARITQSQLQDPTWMMKNPGVASKAAAEGRIVWGK